MASRKGSKRGAGVAPKAGHHMHSKNTKLTKGSNAMAPVKQKAPKGSGKVSRKASGGYNHNTSMGM
jgi:hypothetical protein